MAGMFATRRSALSRGVAAALAAAGVAAGLTVTSVTVAHADPSATPAPTPAPTVSVTGGAQPAGSSADTSTAASSSASGPVAGDVLDQLAEEYTVGSGGGQLSNLLKTSLRLRAMGFRPSKANLQEIAAAMNYRPNQLPLIAALKDTIAYQGKIKAQMEILQQYQQQQAGGMMGTGQGAAPGLGAPAPAAGAPAAPIPPGVAPSP